MKKKGEKLLKYLFLDTKSGLGTGLNYGGPARIKIVSARPGPARIKIVSARPGPARSTSRPGPGRPGKARWENFWENFTKFSFFLFSNIHINFCCVRFIRIFTEMTVPSITLPF
jgi:hypothetical protein